MALGCVVAPDNAVLLNEGERNLKGRWTLDDVYSELESRGELGRKIAADLRTKDIYSFHKVKINRINRETGKRVSSKWENGFLGFETNDRLYINRALNLERAIETLIHEYSHTLGYNELEARIYATQIMHDLGLEPIKASWIGPDGVASPTVIKNDIPKSYDYRSTLGKLRGEKLLQTGVPEP